jgi:hypothetical protein
VLLGAALAMISTRGEAQERDEAPELAGVPASLAALGEALGDRFATCYSAEAGALTDADRSVLRDALTPRATATAEALGATGCDSAANEIQCVEALQRAPCDALARVLAEPPGRQSAAPSWATGYAHVLMQRIERCYVTEADGGSLDDVRATLAAFERETAGALGSLSQREDCHANENFLPACSTALTAMSCDVLGGHLANDPGALLRSLGDACHQLLSCEGEAGDGGVDLDVVP